jgi:hypothetical protein
MMAEVLAILGAGAAAAQLSHYGFLFFSSTSALSHQIRHASDAIEYWDHKSLWMQSTLNNVRGTLHGLDQTTLWLINRCINDVDEVRSLLTRFRARSTGQKHAGLRSKLFVLQKETIIKHKMEAVEHIFNMMALGRLL